jgi:glutamyl-tRNA synthetase
LGLNWDEEAIYQYARAAHHREVAEALVAKGEAYRCYVSPEELATLRAGAEAEGKVFRFHSPWRDRTDAPKDTPHVIRLRAPQQGHTLVSDDVQGEVRFPNEELDDLVLLRSDGTPTYNLAVDDHLNNAPKQQLIYQAMGWEVPCFSHIPLIHGPDGAKLSKRHGALGIEAYRDMGYLPQALRNYLLRLGWGHGDDEIISNEQAVEWFNLKGIGKSPSRMDFAKLENLNGHYIRETPNSQLLPEIVTLMEETLGAKITLEARERILKGLPSLKQRAKTMVQLSDSALFYARTRPIPIEDAAQKPLVEESARTHLAALIPHLQNLANWEEAAIDTHLKAYLEIAGAKFKDIGVPLRAALTGSLTAPGVGEVMAILGKEEALGRLADIVVQ